MDLLAVLKIAVRRWYVLMPLLVLTLVGAWTVSQQVKPTYEINGILPITAPYVDSEEASNQLSRNMFLDFVTTGAIMGVLGDSADVRTVVEQGGGDPNYEIVSESAVLTVSVSTDSPRRALLTYRLVAGGLGERLDALQADASVPPAFRITISDVLQPGQVRETLGNRQRVLIASAALGSVLSIASCVFADYLLSRRQPRRRGDDLVGAPVTGTGEPAPGSFEHGHQSSNAAREVLRERESPVDGPISKVAMSDLDGKGQRETGSVAADRLVR